MTNLNIPLSVDEHIWKQSSLAEERHQDWWCWLYQFLVEPAKVQWSSHTWLSLIDEPHHRTRLHQKYRMIVCIVCTVCSVCTFWSVLSILSVLSDGVPYREDIPHKNEWILRNSHWPSLPLIFRKQCCRFLGTRWRSHVLAPFYCQIYPQYKGKFSI